MTPEGSAAVVQMVFLLLWEAWACFSAWAGEHGAPWTQMNDVFLAPDSWVGPEGQGSEAPRGLTRKPAVRKLGRPP